MLTRLYPDQVTPERAKEFRDCVQSVRYNNPLVLEEMFAAVEDKQEAAKKYGVEPLDSKAYDDLPMLRVDGARVNEAVHNFSRKLFLALYYKHAEKPLSSDGGIAVKWYSNLQVMNDEIPRELAPIIHNLPKLERKSTSLQNQFFYRFGSSDGGEIYAFLAFFRQSFAVLGYIHKDAANFNLPEHTIIHRPLRWDGSA